jgi:hypothetical protein
MEPWRPRNIWGNLLYAVLVRVSGQLSIERIVDKIIYYQRTETLCTIDGMIPYVLCHEELCF